MHKKEAVQLFGSVAKASRALEVSQQAISKWPDELPLRISDRVLGAACRLNIKIPERLKK